MWLHANVTSLTADSAYIIDSLQEDGSHCRVFSSTSLSITKFTMTGGLVLNQ